MNADCSKVNPGEIESAIRTLHPAGATFEIRIPKVKSGPPCRGYFDDPALAAESAASMSGKAEGVYITLNPVLPDLLARANNRLNTGKPSTSDKEITQRCWLPIDIDPERQTGISSNDAEHKAALELANGIRAWLHSEGWPDPILADSGNGAHLLYRIDLPNDPDSTALVKGVLEALAHRFSNDACKVDTAVYNASRIWKLYGTLAAKGDETPTRPHRLARIITTPPETAVVPRDKLGELAASLPAPAPQKPSEAPTRPTASSRPDNFFGQVNQAAIERLSTWVPVIFPDAKTYHGGYRVSSESLGRPLEEDLSITPDGVKDFGVHDMGDPQRGSRTAIDLMIEHGGCADAQAAAFKLCELLGATPESFGWHCAAIAPPPTAQLENGDLTPPPWQPLNLFEMAGAKLHPKCIVEGYLYADLAATIAEGGTGKTTVMLYESIHIALGWPIWGNRVVHPGRTLYVTAEDGKDILSARLNKLMEALALTDEQRQTVADSIMVWDVSGSMVKLAELDARGNLKLTALADQIVTAYHDTGLVQVIFDPQVSFGPGERIVNDGEQAIVTACRRIVRGLECAVRLIHHSGQSNARGGVTDQYAGRGGTALPDGCRMVTVLANAKRVMTTPPTGFDLSGQDSGFLLSRPKLSYCPPQPNIWIRRRGWTYAYFVEQPRDPEAVRDNDADKVANFLADELTRGRKYTARSLEAVGSLKLPRARLRAALAMLEVTGRVEERDLPAGERKGVKKTFLYCAATFGAIDPEKSTDQPASSSFAPPISIAPPYRDGENGAIDRRPSPPPSLNCAEIDGAIAAQWRNRASEGETGQKNVPAAASARVENTRVESTATVPDIDWD